ncbi:MAG: hypothetical protein QNJ54_19120 [Prochloraceae cyanobacterium]|nr:hypothetical protein [Prochloraceae cyanobacterium]
MELNTYLGSQGNLRAKQSRRDMTGVGRSACQTSSKSRMYGHCGDVVAESHGFTVGGSKNRHQTDTLTWRGFLTSFIPIFDMAKF